MIPLSDFTKSGALPLLDVVGPTFDEINEKYGTKIEPTWKSRRSGFQGVTVYSTANTSAIAWEQWQSP